jgi:hypothetical protein
MKSFLKILVLSFVLFGAANSVFAEITCHAGIRYNLPSQDGWICYPDNAGNCLACSEEIEVRG